MNFLKKCFNRTVVMLIAIVLEVLFIIRLFKWFGKNAAWIDGVLRVLSVLIVLGINKNSTHLSFDMMWILLIIVSPIFGTAMYLLLGANLFTSKTFYNILITTMDSAKYYKQDEEVLKEAENQAGNFKGQLEYLSKGAHFPVYRNREFDYWGTGDAGYPTLLEEMRKAEKFIFLEYFIIEEGKMWDGMLEILEEKAAQGLDIRVLYDDLGSFFTLPLKYADELEKKGVKCMAFNRINPRLNIIINHRDHRKLMVIDGKVAFSGGVNLADEYINAKTKFGHWKDNIIRIKGEAVWSYTVLFLTHWNALRKTDENFNVFKVPYEGSEEFDGYIAPYGETPIGEERTAQNVYLNILNQAKDYVYIFTPYLIIDTEFISALVLTAKRGVDVRLMTPGIPDKKIVFSITQSFYKTLINGGVKIFEYSPGFVHSKVFVSDDRICTVGTVNLDYRSLYLHFENGIYVFDSKKVLDVKQDFLDAFEVSHQVTPEEAKRGLIMEFLLSVLRLFAPLM